MMRMMPIIVALDTDRNGEISEDEINNAAKALRTLDKNEDGKLTPDELRPNFGPGGPGPQGGPRGERRPDGGLTAEELRPQFSPRVDRALKPLVCSQSSLNSRRFYTN